MKFATDFLRRYLKNAPVALAVERSLECHILSSKEFTRPVLDVGCGDGLFASILFAEHVDTGIDPNERELARAKEIGYYGEVIQCYADRIPKADGSFNTIYSNSVLEHITDIEPVLKELGRLLAKDGHLYVTVPTDRFEQYTVVNRILVKLGMKSLSLQYRAWFNGFWSQVHHYEPDDWARLFEKNGFRVVERIEYGNKKACTFDDIMVPFAFPCWLSKKILNRWVVFPYLRPLVTWPVQMFLSRTDIERSTNIENGGLVFLHLRKGA